MNPREELLHSIQTGLVNQIITRGDLASFLATEAPAPHDGLLHPSAPTADTVNKKLSVIDVLFYLAGLIFYAALMVTAFQAGSSSSSARIIITGGTGVLIWIVTYVIGKKPVQSDVQKGLVNSLMLTGSLAVSSGGFIAAFQVAGGNGTGAGVTYAMAIAMFVLGIAHIVFDNFFRHLILIVLGVLLVCLAFPTFMAALLSGMSVGPDVWAAIGILTGVLIGMGGRIAAKTVADRAYLQSSFDSVGGFVILSSIYGATLSSSLAPIWEVLLPLVIYVAFYISIKQRSKNFLATGSFFLVVFLITVSFKYFSGLGVAFSLVLSALSILATAFMATNINKRYIKRAVIQ